MCSLNEAELIETFQTYVSLLDSQIFGFISLLSGFIVLSYFVADKLTSMLTGILIALYTIASGIFIARMAFLRRDFAALHAHILDLQASGAIDAPWFGSNPHWASEVISYLIWGVTFGGYLGSVLFFFVQRKQKLNQA